MAMLLISLEFSLQDVVKVLGKETILMELVVVLDMGDVVALVISMGL